MAPTQQHHLKPQKIFPPAYAGGIKIENYMTNNDKFNFEANLMLFVTASQEAYSEFQKISGIEMEKEELVRRLTVVAQEMKADLNQDGFQL